MLDIISSFGLNLDNLDFFGFSGETATEAFGEENVVTFVSNVFENALPAGLSWSGSDYFNFAQQADDVLETIPGVDFSYVDYFNQLNTQLLQDTGHGLSDLHWSFDGNGNITGGVTGVGSATININDALSTALSNPNVAAGFDQVNNAIAGTGLNLTDIFNNLGNLDALASI